MTITDENLRSFEHFLIEQEKSPATCEKYLHDVRSFALWLDGRELCKAETGAYKQALSDNGRAPSGINAALSALNGFLRFIGRDDCRVRFLHVQRRMYRESKKDLTRSDYEKLVETAATQGKRKLALILEAICSTGIRVSELKYFTVEALREGEAEIQLKGKIRTILFPGKLAKKLLKYAKESKISTGEVFLSCEGRSIDRRRIWEEMKKLCSHCGVDPTKVFPHNLRHLFARTYYKICRDTVRLSSILGHSSLETTKIYLMISVSEQQTRLNRMRLVT